MSGSNKERFYVYSLEKWMMFIIILKLRKRKRIGGGDRGDVDELSVRNL